MLASIRSNDSSMTPSGYGDVPTVYLWMPDCSEHGGAYLDEAFFNTSISDDTGTYSYRDWLEAFVQDGSKNTIEVLADGWISDSTPMVSHCP